MAYADDALREILQMVVVDYLDAHFSTRAIFRIDEICLLVSEQISSLVGRVIQTLTDRPDLRLAIQADHVTSFNNLIDCCVEDIFNVCFGTLPTIEGLQTLFEKRIVRFAMHIGGF